MQLAHRNAKSGDRNTIKRIIMKYVTPSPNPAGNHLRGHNHPMISRLIFPGDMGEYSER